MICFGEKNYKYFIRYLHNDHKVKLLHVILPKTSAYVKIYDRQTKWMHFFIENDDLLEKYNNVRYKVNADIRKEFDTEPVCNKNFRKTKLKSHGDEVTNFYDKQIPKVGSNHTCLAVITLDSALKKDDNYYPQMLLKECKYIDKKVIRHIIDNSSNFSSSDESEEEQIFAAFLAYF